MSQTTSVVYGRGFEIADATFGNILQFIANHKSTLYNLNVDDSIIDKAVKLLEDVDFDDIEDVEDLDEELYDALQALSDNDITWFRLGDIVAFIIATETDISFEFSVSQDDCMGEASILLPDLKPWFYSEKEKSLTEEQFDEILKPYISELELDPNSIDNLEIEYYG